MKKLVYICLSVCLLSACSSESESSNDKAEKATEEETKSTDQKEDKEAIPEGLEGDILPCDCYKKTTDLMDRVANGEDVEKELLAVNEICGELAQEIGEQAFKTEMELCQRADTLDVDITGLTVCDCKTEITAMMDRAMEMETDKTLATEFRLIQDKCAVLEAQMSSTKYKAALKACD